MKGIFIDKKKEKEVAQQYVDSLATKTPNVDQLVVNLSGGNQQKVVIAKWLTRDCDILIFDELPEVSTLERKTKSITDESAGRAGQSHYYDFL